MTWSRRTHAATQGTMDTPPRRGPIGCAGGGAKRQKVESIECPSSRSTGTLATRAESPEVESPQAKPGAITDGDKKGDDVVANPVLDAESPEVPLDNTDAAFAERKKAGVITMDDVESGRVSYGGGIRNYHLIDESWPEWYWETVSPFKDDATRYPRTSDETLRDDPEYYQVLKDMLEYGYDIGTRGIYTPPEKQAMYRRVIRKVIQSKEPNKVQIVEQLLQYGFRVSLPGEEPYAVIAAKLFMKGKCSLKLINMLKWSGVSFDEPNSDGETANSILGPETQGELEKSVTTMI